MFGKYVRFAVCLGIATTIAACHQAPEPSGTQEPVEVALNTTRTLIVKLTGDGASAASVRYAGVAGARSGNDITYENAAPNGTINVTGNGVIAQSVDIEFGDRSTIVIEINIPLASTNIVSAADAENGTSVENDDRNQDNTGVTSTLNLGTNGSMATYIPGSSRDYGLVVYTKPVAPVTSASEGQIYERSPYSVDCEPSGATFDPAAHIELNIPGIGEIGKEGIDFKLGNTSEQALNQKVEGDYLKADLPHFSAWNVFVKAVCINISETTENIASGPLADGANPVIYKQRCGFESNETGILEVFFKLLFGATYNEIEKKTVINAEGTGSYTISQSKITMTFRAGLKTFQAIIYGEPKCVVTYNSGEVPDTEPVVPTHNGGSND